MPAARGRCPLLLFTIMAAARQAEVALPAARGRRPLLTNKTSSMGALVHGSRRAVRAIHGSRCSPLDPPEPFAMAAGSRHPPRRLDQPAVRRHCSLPHLASPTATAAGSARRPPPQLPPHLTSPAATAAGSARRPPPLLPPHLALLASGLGRHVSDNGL
jgi:hypothetical protein